jgi:hypothetical protein
MTKFLWLALCIYLFSAGCSNDFEVTAPWKDIPVVYGLLDIGDSAHYIRVEKAFLDARENALEIAQRPDSLYYQNAKVQLIRVSSGQAFTLQRVDGNIEGYPRENGIFAKSPNWLYKIDSSSIRLAVKEKIRFKLDRGNGLPEVTAETVVLEKGRQRTPQPVDGRFAFQYNLPVKVSWSAAPEARIFDVVLKLNYAEWPVSNPSQVQTKSLEWVWVRGLRADSPQPELSVEKTGLEFYQFLKGNLQENIGLRRIFLGTDLVIINGGAELEKFISVSQANSGLSGAQELPVFTNLSEGRGIFSSRNFLVTKNVQLTSESRDSLRFGIYTKSLNFQ